jgi:dTDP-4-amino-4,6-dideoxygalactose transaminase
MKATVNELAIFGGPPEFESPVHVGRPNIGDRSRILARVGAALDRCWLTNDGPYVQEFEARVAEFVGVRHCVAVSSGTTALEIAIRAAGMSGEVIVPSFTFIATAHALRWQGITPVFCDIAPGTFNIDPSRVEELITPRTSGIIGVHLWGKPCDVESLQRISENRGLPLLFDAAHAFGCSYKGGMIGRFGAAEVLSFHATKCVNAFEGGAVVTQDAGFAGRVRLMRNFGFVDLDRVECLGTNGKLNEISAAMGLSSLEAMDEFVRVNRRNYLQYRSELLGVGGISVIEYDEKELCNFHYIVLEIEEAGAGLGRDQLQEILWQENVLARRYFYPGCHRMKPYCDELPGAGPRLPETERLSSRVLCLPNGMAVGAGEIGRICQIIRLSIGNAAEIRARKAAGGGNR